MRRRAVEQRELSQRPGARVITLNVIFQLRIELSGKPLDFRTPHRLFPTHNIVRSGVDKLQISRENC